MKVHDEAFYELMGDYHWDMCGYYIGLSKSCRRLSWSWKPIDYHQKQYARYDQLRFVASMNKD
jgi:hypothetical protein